MVKANDCRAIKHLINFATHYLNRKLHTNESDEVVFYGTFTLKLDI